MCRRTTPKLDVGGVGENNLSVNCRNDNRRSVSTKSVFFAKSYQLYC